MLNLAGEACISLSSLRHTVISGERLEGFAQRFAPVHKTSLVISDHELEGFGNGVLSHSRPAVQQNDG